MHLRFTRAGACALALAILGATAQAADTPAQQQYQRDRATCLAGASGQDRDTCLREAAAAYQEARTPSRSGAEPPDYQRNAQARCALHPTPADQQSCRLRLQAPAQGSVGGGGLLREATETTRP